MELLTKKPSRKNLVVVLSLFSLCVAIKAAIADEAPLGSAANPLWDSVLVNGQINNTSHLFWIDTFEANEENVHRTLARPVNVGLNAPAPLSLSEAVEYCERRGKRLPTLDEWQVTARAGCAMVGVDGSTSGDCFTSFYGTIYTVDSAHFWANIGAMRAAPLDVMDARVGIDAAGTMGLTGNLPEWVTDGPIYNIGDLTQERGAAASRCGKRFDTAFGNATDWAAEHLCEGVPHFNDDQSTQEVAAARCVWKGPSVSETADATALQTTSFENPIRNLAPSRSANQKLPQSLDSQRTYFQGIRDQNIGARVRGYFTDLANVPFAAGFPVAQPHRPSAAINAAVVAAAPVADGGGAPAPAAGVAPGPAQAAPAPRALILLPPRLPRVRAIPLPPRQ